MRIGEFLLNTKFKPLRFARPLEKGTMLNLNNVSTNFGNDLF